MCEMSPYYPTNTGGYDQFNGDHVIGQCHENGRAHPHHQQYHTLQYSGAPQAQPNFPRYPPFDRLEAIRPMDANNAHHDPSPYYNTPQPTTPHQPPPPSQQAQAMTPQTYDNCGSRGTMTPPHEQQQYPSCKMQQAMLPHSDVLAAGPQTMVAGSPSPHPGAQNAHMYQGPIASPNQPSSGNSVGSPIYPWMRSQFGECLV